MTNKEDTSSNDHKPARKNPGEGGRTYTMQDLMDAAKDILRSDEIGKKLPDSALENLSKLLAKTAMKGDL